MSFPEAEAMVELLAEARAQGRSFGDAWRESIGQVRRGRLHDNERWRLASAALAHHKQAWRRAYYREQPTRLDDAGATLARAMEGMYDDSEFAEPQFIAMPEAA